MNNPQLYVHLPEDISKTIHRLALDALIYQHLGNVNNEIRTTTPLLYSTLCDNAIIDNSIVFSYADRLPALVYISAVLNIIEYRASRRL